MGANFYDNSGKMAGIDLHKYRQALPPPTGLLQPAWPHAVAIHFSSTAAKAYLRTSSVTSDSQLMLAGGFDNGPVWVHAFLPVPPPHPAEGAIFALVLATSTSTAQLTVSSVTGEGNPLAVCITGCWGLNVNCCEPMDMPCGHVIVVNSVKTNPTIGDYLSAIVMWLLNAVFGWRVGKLLDPLKKVTIAILKTLLRFFQDLIPSITAKLREFVEDVKRDLREVRKMLRENRKPRTLP
jgi:hypothetical protein